VNAPLSARGSLDSGGCGQSYSATLTWGILLVVGQLRVNFAAKCVNRPQEKPSQHLAWLIRPSRTPDADHYVWRLAWSDPIGSDGNHLRADLSTFWRILTCEGEYAPSRRVHDGLHGAIKQAGTI